MDDSRFAEQKFSELKYLFLAKSGQEHKNYRGDTASSLPALDQTPPAAQMLELPQQQDHDLNDSGDALNDSGVVAFPYAWNVVQMRRHRCFTVSHGTPPPAPPSTPTSSSMALASSSHNSSGSGTNSVDYDSDCYNFNLLYILDYAPKYKKKLKEQQRTDSELAELFNVVTITGSSADKSAAGHSSRALKSAAAASPSTSFSSKPTPERGISSASRNIRKQERGTKIFKIHRNPKEFFRDPDEEDSVSAPEYEAEENIITHRRRFRRFKVSRRHARREQRRLDRYEMHESMDAVADTFDAAMSFADA